MSTRKFSLVQVLLVLLLVGGIFLLPRYTAQGLAVFGVAELMLLCLWLKG